MRRGCGTAWWFALAFLTSGRVPAMAQDSQAESLKAFAAMLPVLQSPRCMNCHTIGDAPRQGDDRHLHGAGVRRGADGHGATGLACATCHQATNQANGVPGAPDWHLAPLSMGWEGLSDGELCRLLLDRSRNGNRSADDIARHLTDPTLVAWAWSAASDIEGTPRLPPPITQDALVRSAQRWAANGAACPQ